MAWINTNPTEAIVESDEDYWQPLSLRYVLSSKFSVTLEDAKIRVREKTTRYAGVTLQAAETLGSSSSSQTLSGSFSFEDYSAKVSRRRVNPCGGYDVTVTEKWTALYINGTWTAGQQESVFMN